MEDYIFPRYGKVAIVDDKYDEVKAIQNILAEKGVPYIFYDYQSMLDADIVKVDGIRLLFLDIRLEDGMSEEKNLLTVLASTVERIIPVNNGPYYIILWTNEAVMKDKVIEYLNTNLDEHETTKPSMISTMDKKAFLTKSLDDIKNVISSLYAEQNMLAFLTEIENRTMQVTPNVIKMIVYRFLKEVNNSELEKLFVRLAMTEKDNCESAFSATKIILYQIFELIRDRYMEIISDESSVESLANYWKFDFSDKKMVDELLKEKEVEQKAIINTVLNANVYAEKSDNVPGKIYVHDNDTLTINPDVLMESTFGKNRPVFISGKTEIPYELIPIELDITPSCDYAQRKNHMLRTLYGYIIYFKKIEGTPVEDWAQIDYHGKTDGKTPDYVYVTPAFYINKQMCVLALNTKMLGLEEHNYSDNLTYLFRLNSELTNEIRKKAGEVISRLGFNSINY